MAHPTGLTRTVLETIRKHGMIPAGSAVLVAVSGGPDSVALLRVLEGAAELHSWKLSVAHLDHGLRGDASAGDACFVEALARSLSLPFYRERVRTDRVAARRKISLEEAGRQARYGFLSKAARDCGASVAATGHTLDDQAETVLLRLIRGSGPEGLAGIHPVVCKEGLPAIVRPLLETTRAEIIKFLDGVGQEYREDSSNLDKRFARNRIRHDLLPLLRSFNPGIAQTLARTAEIMRHEDRIVGTLAGRAFRECFELPGGRMLVDPAAFATLDAGLRRRALRRALAAEGRRPPGFSRVESLLKRIAKHRNGLLPLDGRDVCDSFAPRYEIECPVPGEIEIPSTAWTLRLQLRKRADLDKIRGRGATIQLTGSVEDGSAVVRNRREGDRFHPLGGPGSRSLKRYFIDHKVPRRLRDRLPVVLLNGRIAWVAGGHIDQRFKVKAADDTVIEATLSGSD